MDKFYINGRELHMMGEFVCVAWNIKEIKHSNTVAGVYRVAFDRLSEPYIDFVDVRRNQGDFYLDKDSPVEGGLSADFAKQIYDELGRAIDYIEEIIDGE